MAYVPIRIDRIDLNFLKIYEYTSLKHLLWFNFNVGLGSVRDVAPAIISHEQTQ